MTRFAELRERARKQLQRTVELVGVELGDRDITVTARRSDLASVATIVTLRFGVVAEFHVDDGAAEKVVKNLAREAYKRLESYSRAHFAERHAARLRKTVEPMMCTCIADFPYPACPVHTQMGPKT